MIVVIDQDIMYARTGRVSDDALQIPIPVEAKDCHGICQENLTASHRDPFSTAHAPSWVGVNIPKWRLDDRASLDNSGLFRVINVKET